jgi:hypothetical protein
MLQCTNALPDFTILTPQGAILRNHKFQHPAENGFKDSFIPDSHILIM